MEQPLDLGNGSEKSQRTRLGKTLSKIRDRVFDDLVVTAGGQSRGSQRWRLRQVRSSGAEPQLAGEDVVDV
jgi:hypothetical protein